jgi:hypothetical protein
MNQSKTMGKIHTSLCSGNGAQVAAISLLLQASQKPLQQGVHVGDLDPKLII